MNFVENNSLYSSIFLFFIAVGIRAIFSFLETSITALRLFKLKELAQSTQKYRPLFQALEDDPHRVLITILIANNLTEVTAAMLGAHITDTLANLLNFSSGLSTVFGILLITMVILIFGEIIPKNIAKVRGEKLFSSTLWLTNIMFYLLYPFVTVLVRVINFILKSKNNIKDNSEEITSEKEIQFLIEYINEKGLMEGQKTSMLKSIFELGTTPVRDIIVPENRIISISINASIKEALQIFGKYHYSRLPIYEHSLNNIIGLLHQKDLFLLLSKNQEKTIKEIMRPILFIPESMKVNQLLKELREQRMHMAMVLNEHGGIIGLVTLEDALEEIVGDIRDEHESIDEKIIPLKSESWLIDASIELEELSLLLNIKFETEGALTLAGFLSEQLQHMPHKGERILYKNFYFQIQQASAKHVSQVLVFLDKS